MHFFAVSTFITTYHIRSEYTSLIVRTRASRAVNDLMDLQPDTQRVEVTFNPHRISADDIQDTISDLGYTVEVGEAPAPAD